MAGEIGQLASGSFRGFSPRVALKLEEQGIRADNILDHRGKEDARVLRDAGNPQSAGCLNAVLALPVLRQVREALPQGFKDSVKDVVKHVLVPELAEP